jgi:hypothetical protein
MQLQDVQAIEQKIVLPTKSIWTSALVYGILNPWPRCRSALIELHKTTPYQTAQRLPYSCGAVAK